MLVRTVFSASLVAVILATTGSAAFAQRYRNNYDGGFAQPGPGYYGERQLNQLPYSGPSDKYGYPVRGASACIKLCPQDNNPCDPIYFKTADNRCSYGSGSR